MSTFEERRPGSALVRRGPVVAPLLSTIYTNRRSAVASNSTDLLQGTLDLLILKTLSRGPQHGWGVAQAIQETSRNLLQVNQGSLYPALHRLEEQEWIAAEWGTSENNRRAKFYQLTAAGRRQLARQTEGWRQYAQAVQWILQTT